MCIWRFTEKIWTRCRGAESARKKSCRQLLTNQYTQTSQCHVFFFICYAQWCSKIITHETLFYICFDGVNKFLSLSLPLSLSHYSQFQWNFLICCHIQWIYWFQKSQTLSCSSFYLSLKREVNGLKAKLKVSQLQVGNTALRSTRYLQPKRGEEIKKKNIFILKMLL